MPLALVSIFVEDMLYRMYENVQKEVNKARFCNFFSGFLQSGSRCDISTYEIQVVFDFLMMYALGCDSLMSLNQGQYGSQSMVTKVAMSISNDEKSE